MNRIFTTILFLICTVGLCAQEINLFTIPTQSASFIRMPSQEASRDADAVYYNPAGLTHLRDGWHFSVSNQMLRQESTVTSDYEYLNEVPKEYTGVAKSMVFPSIYGTYKKGKFATFFGISPIGGAGGSSYSNLPSADQGVSDIVPTLQNSILNNVDNLIYLKSEREPGYSNIEGYTMDFVSSGYGFSPGVQLGGSYQLTDVVSASLGLRLVQSITVAEGHLGNIQIYAPDHGGFFSPDEYLRYVAEDPDLDAEAFVLEVTADQLEEELQDVEIDVRQSGFGVTPIIGVNIKPSEKMNIGFKYEHNTKITMTTEVIEGKDGAGQFVDGDQIRSDLPGFLAVGTEYQVYPRLMASVSFRYFFDKMADMNGREEFIKSNYYEVAIGAEYDLTTRWILSGGYTFNNPDVMDQFQNEVDFRLPGHTGAIGGAYAVNEDLKINIGFLYTKFVSDKGVSEHVSTTSASEEVVLVNRDYKKDAMIFALGVDFSFAH